MGPGTGEQLVQAIEATFQQLHVTALDLGAAGGHRFQQRFDAVAKVADGIAAGHACATLQGHRNDPAGPCLPRRRCRPARGHAR
ncbi:hypothetical protein G6F63_015485 [Rhizopus arrhizus]|nr:hypothetical protein G6F63_015485 [Rhizopus arrhizus]